MDTEGDLDKKDVRRPMNAFLIFCKRHRTMVRERNPHLDNRSVTKILGDLWANIGEEEKNQYTDLAKQYKDAFMRANPDYKWHNSEKGNQANSVKPNTKLTNNAMPSTSSLVIGEGTIVPGKLADPSNMGGLSLLMEGAQVKRSQLNILKEPSDTSKTVTSLEMSLQHPYGQMKETERGNMLIDEMSSKSSDQSGTAGGGLPIDMTKKAPILSDVYPQPIAPSMLRFNPTVVKDTLKNDPTSLKIDPTRLKINPLMLNMNPSTSKLEPAVLNIDSSAPKIDQSMLKIDPSALKVDTNTEVGIQNVQGPDRHSGKFVMDHIIDKLYLSTIENINQRKGFNMQLSEPTNQVPLPKPQEPIAKASKFPPSQGKKSFHTSMAVRNLLEFTRKAAAFGHNLPKDFYKPVPVMKHEDQSCIPETKQKLKDFCLKKEGRPKVVTGTGQPIDVNEVKEFKRKRCYSESIAEFYKSQEKRIKLESEGSDQGSSSPRDDDNQPTRKSRRRNRGQRYQELINEGIIQPSKARMAAMKSETSFKTISFKHSFLSKRAEDLGDEVLSVYPRQIRKRTMSESEKNRTVFEESGRYITGDFDLEAHIKTLPACSIDKVVKPKRTVGRSLSESENTAGSFCNEQQEKGNQAEVKLTVPPHIKAKPITTPVVGSKKRKARKHSITHLQPVKDNNTGAAATLLSGVIQQRLSTDKIPEDTANVIGSQDGRQTNEKTEQVHRRKADCQHTNGNPFKTEGCVKCKSKMKDVNLNERDEYVNNSQKQQISYDIVKKEKNTVLTDRTSMQNKDISHGVKEETVSEKVVCDELHLKTSTAHDFSTRDSKDEQLHSASDEHDKDETNINEANHQKLLCHQDENSNETESVCETLSKKCEALNDKCETLNEKCEALGENHEAFSDKCDMNQVVTDNSHDGNVTMVTGISLAVPIIDKESTQSGLKERELASLAVTECSSPVAMTTIQTSLTCPC